MEDVTIFIAFFAGILSFLSPCVLPLVPAYISFLSGVSLEELSEGGQKKKIMWHTILTALFFVAGFSIVFIALGASASFVGKILFDHIAILTKIAGVVIFLLGLHLLGILKINVLNYEKRLHIDKFHPGLLGALIIGIAFGFGWTPCIGPILAGILTIAATKETMVEGMFLLLAYSLGLGIPFILTAFAVGAFMRVFDKYKRFIRWGEIAAGIFLMIIGVLIFFNNLNVILKYIPAWFYEFSK